MNEIKELIISLIRDSVAKNFDIRFSECPDFNDAHTFNIFLHKGDNDECVYESDRCCLHYTDYLEIEVKKALIYLESQER